MVREWEVRWEGELPASPQDVWDAITQHADGYLWPIDYEPRVGGAERGLTAGGGTVTAWDPPRHFATRTRPETERDGFNELDYVLEPLGAATYLRYTHRCEIPAEDYDRQLDAVPRSTRPSTSTRSASTRATSPAASRSTSSVDEVAGRPPRSSRCGGRSGCPTTSWPATRRLEPAGSSRSTASSTTRRARSCGIRGADALLRVYGRDRWGWPVGVAHHLFAPGAARRRASGRGATGSLACSRRDGGVMAQYAVLIFERVAPGGPPAGGDAGAHGRCPSAIAEQGGRIVAGLALEPHGHGDVDPRRRAHRRPVHRDEGGARPASSCSRRATSTTRSRWPR